MASSTSLVTYSRINIAILTVTVVDRRSTHMSDEVLEVVITTVEAKSVMECLAKLHAQLNAIAVPRVYHSTAVSDVFDQTPTVSC